MSLNIEKLDTRMENFLRYPREIEVGIDQDWYKLDENNQKLKEKNFQNNILRILLEQLVDQFQHSEEDRSEILKNILDFLNDFIKERFIPGAYHDSIKKIFNYVKDLQYKPTLDATNLVFKELSENAQKAFRDEGVRAQTSGLSRAPSGRDANTMQADPVLVEILFIQLVWDAQKRNSTRQKLLDSIEADMTKMENLFGDDPAYTIVGTFSSLRSTLLEAAQQESPLPALIKYILSLLRKSKKDKQLLENKYKEFLEDKAADEWKEITKVKAKPAVSIWKKKEIEPQESAEDKKKKEHKENKKKAKKALIEKLESDAISGVKDKGLTKDAFKGVIDDLMGSIKTLGSSGNSGSSNLLGNLLGG